MKEIVTNTIAGPMITMGITAAGAALVIHGGQAAICALIVIFGIIVKYEGRK